MKYKFPDYEAQLTPVIPIGAICDEAFIEWLKDELADKEHARSIIENRKRIHGKETCIFIHNNFCAFGKLQHAKVNSRKYKILEYKDFLAEDRDIENDMDDFLELLPYGP